MELMFILNLLTPHWLQPQASFLWNFYWIAPCFLPASSSVDISPFSYSITAAFFFCLPLIIRCQWCFAAFFSANLAALLKGWQCRCDRQSIALAKTEVTHQWRHIFKKMFEDCTTLWCLEAFVSWWFLPTDLLNKQNLLKGRDFSKQTVWMLAFN